MQKNRLCLFVLTLILALAGSALHAGVKLAGVFGDNMVLQRDQALPVWGSADKGEEITVRIAGQTQAAKAGEDGRWKVTLEKLKVGEPLEMSVKGSSGEEIKLKNILVGEVWVCSGQSNMEMGMGACNNAQDEIAAADYPNIRLFTVAKNKAAEPTAELKADWIPCSPKTIGKLWDWASFSGTGYYFGRHLHKELGVPIGLIHTSWGGTPAEFWTSHKALEADPALKPMAQGESSCLYNGMIAPLIPFAIRGAIWYQGESNIPIAYKYRTLLPAMIRNWRTDWGQGDFPFGIVQIAPFRYSDKDPACWAELCEAQAMTAKNVPNTGLAVTVDIGDLKDIHPKNKQDVGRRLALWALAKVYGKDIVYSGPLYKSMAVEGGKIRVQFDRVGGGLISRDGKPLTDFTIAGNDQKFVPATADIDGACVVVSSPDITAPVAVRFAWRDDTSPNLANKEGLPAGPFRTDSWKGLTERN
jgi:sialate O-acetylesterase